jgi:multidrug efflux pump subunit AcrB
MVAAKFAGHESDSEKINRARATSDATDDTADPSRYWRATLAAIFALLPVALGIGQRAAMQQPLAIAIVSGLMIQFPLVLMVLPALLLLLGAPLAEGREPIS